MDAPLVVQAIRGLEGVSHYLPEKIRLHERQPSMCGWWTEWRMSDDEVPTCPQCRDARNRYRTST